METRKIKQFDSRDELLGAIRAFNNKFSYSALYDYPHMIYSIETEKKTGNKTLLIHVK